MKPISQGKDSPPVTDDERAAIEAALAAGRVTKCPPRTFTEDAVNGQGWKEQSSRQKGRRLFARKQRFEAAARKRARLAEEESRKTEARCTIKRPDVVPEPSVPTAPPSVCSEPAPAPIHPPAPLGPLPEPSPPPALPEPLPPPPAPQIHTPKAPKPRRAPRVKRKSVLALSPDERDAALRSLRQGYGVEDVAVMHGFSVDDVRAYVRHLRRLGVLRPTLGVPVERNHRALKVMGLRSCR